MFVVDKHYLKLPQQESGPQSLVIETVAALDKPLDQLQKLRRKTCWVFIVTA